MKKIAFLIGMVAWAHGMFAQTVVTEAEAVDNAVVWNAAEGARLVGTWTAPENPKAVIVLASGSGQQDRDENIMGHKPFKALAEALSKEGYGVLRLDDRGVGGSTGEVKTATTANFTNDIACALAWMDSIAPGKPKGVLGHSEGGMIAINLAQNPLCDFIITLGAPAMPGDSIILTQGRAVTEAMTGRYDGEPLQKQLLSLAKGDLSKDEAKKQMMELLTAQLGAQAYIPGVKQQLEGQVEMMLSPWYREFLRTDPAPAIKAVNKPWLALNGDKDYQVLPVNLELIGQLNPQAKCVMLPNHNHLFLETTNGLPQEYMMLKGDISDETIAVILRELPALVK